MLQGQVAVVTGASRGIGRALALRLARSGAQVVISARNQDPLERVVEEMRSEGGHGYAVVADASDPQSARKPVRAAVREFGRVDVLVNNVGGTRGSTAWDVFACTDDDFAETMNVTLMSAWWATREALPIMREQRFGRVINIGSGASKTGSGAAAYTTAKHGIAGLTKVLALAAGPYGITVNCLCPGYTNTSALDWDAIAARKGISPEEARHEVEQLNALHRVLEPEELGGMVVLLASPDGAGITGQLISVDGGFQI
jgi:NAD(P)-dependent dehydrogenase (short-subunit alcohol dehydrogenase family)